MVSLADAVLCILTLVSIQTTASVAILSYTALYLYCTSYTALYYTALYLAILYLAILQLRL